jgi:hypothetical protein
LEEGGLQGVGDDLRTFARRQPALFIAATATAGFVITRLLRNASSLQSGAATPGQASLPPAGLGAVPPPVSPSSLPRSAGLPGSEAR